MTLKDYDIYEESNKVFAERKVKANYLIRAKHDRKVCTEEGKSTAHKIKSSLKNAKLLGKIILEVSETKKRKSRTATLSVYAETIYIGMPDKRKKAENYKPVKISAVLCSEHNPPANAKAIEWLLITDLSVSNFEEACEKISWYTCRWQIEIFFKILKSGCTIEKLQLTDKNFSACLSFYMIIA